MRPAVRQRAVPVGISACLLGEPVRYDGGHKRAAFVQTLTEVFAWIPVCPEVGAGMSVPRPPLAITGTASAPRLVTHAGDADWTAAMHAFTGAELERLRVAGICGFVLKSKSPSCGLRGVPVTGQGLFAQALVREMPSLPVADELELADPLGRREFVDAVLALARGRGILAP